MRAVIALALCVLPASALADDVVVTIDGQRHRGTIVGADPGEQVVLASEGRHLRFEADELRYAGPAERAPGPLAEGAAVRVRLRGSDGLVFHRVLGSSTATAWSMPERVRLCAAPCELTLPAGNYHLALSQGAAHWAVSQPVGLWRSGEVTAERVDRSGLRIAGWITIGVGALAAITMMGVPLALEDETQSETAGWLGAGGAVLVATQIAGILMAVQPDSVALRFD
jgi:hypothetical protein